MTPEELSALGSIGTFVVIAVTAVAALIQLRHIRSANQIAAVLEYIKLWESDTIQRANIFVFDKLDEKLRDPRYRRELFERDVDRGAHPELVVADWCEQVGSYIKFGLVSPTQFLDLAGGYLERMWPPLREVVAIRRVTGGPGMYENFEYLAALQQQWSRRHSRGNYPRNLPRLLSDDECRQLAGAKPAEQPDHLLSEV
jgi:hypothetical protein